MLSSFHGILCFFATDWCTVMPKSRAYCQVCVERSMSSPWRSPPKALDLKHPDSPKHGKTPKWCYLGDCRALGEAQQASKAANDKEAKLMPESPLHRLYASGPKHHLGDQGFKQPFDFGEVCCSRMLSCYHFACATLPIVTNAYNLRAQCVPCVLPYLWLVIFLPSYVSFCWLGVAQRWMQQKVYVSKSSPFGPFASHPSMAGYKTYGRTLGPLFRGPYRKFVSAMRE